MAAIVAAGVVGILAGCSSYDAAHNYNAPTPVKTWQPPGGWTRIETPGNFPSGVFACHGHDGVYVAMDKSASIIVVGHDSSCP